MGRTRKRIAGDAAQQGYTSPCRNEIGKSVFHRPTHAEAFSPAIPKAQAVYAPSYGACLGVSPSAEEPGVDDSWLQLCVDGTGETFNRFGAYLQQQGYALTDTRYEGNSMIATVARGETHFQVEYDWVELFLVVEYPNVVMPERQRDATGSTGFVWNGITADAGAASATEAPVSATRQDWHSISSGTWHTVAVRADGTMVAAGDNAKGQCNVSGWKTSCRSAPARGSPWACRATAPWWRQARTARVSAASTAGKTPWPSVRGIARRNLRPEGGLRLIHQGKQQRIDQHALVFHHQLRAALIHGNPPRQQIHPAAVEQRKIQHALVTAHIPGHVRESQGQPFQLSRQGVRGHTRQHQFQQRVRQQCQRRSRQGCSRSCG